MPFGVDRGISTLPIFTCCAERLPGFGLPLFSLHEQSNAQESIRLINRHTLRSGKENSNSANAFYERQARSTALLRRVELHTVSSRGFVLGTLTEGAPQKDSLFVF